MTSSLRWNENINLLHGIPTPMDFGSRDALLMAHGMKKQRIYDQSFWLDQKPYYRFRDHELVGRHVETCLKPLQINKVFMGVLEEDILSSWMQFYIQQKTPFVVSQKGKTLLMWRCVNLPAKKYER